MVRDSKGSEPYNKKLKTPVRANGKIPKTLNSKLEN